MDGSDEDRLGLLAGPIAFASVDRGSCCRFDVFEYRLARLLLDYLAAQVPKNSDIISEVHILQWKVNVPQAPRALALSQR